MSPETTSYTRPLTPFQASKLERWLRGNNYFFDTVPYARFAAEKDKVKVVFYESGKLVIQGKQTRDFIEFVLEPEILGEARLGYEAILDPSILAPRIGVDESGKGDFFGPLCVAAVYANGDIIPKWQDAGVKDSKNISSDQRIAVLAKLIRGTPGCVSNVVPMGNQAYNRLYAKMRNVNDLLAWGHARAIENLLEQKHRMKPPPVRAISDQFATHQATLNRALMRLGQGLEVVQRHKAESDMAVAAASVLARDEFVRRLAALEKTFGCHFPKGASAAVEQAAKEFVQQHGAEKLAEVAKTHFRTAYRAQGLPEPPRKEWRQPGEDSRP